jgi:hypothetical protein
MFLRIFEYPPHTPKSPLDPPDPDRERERELEERKRDAELAADVALRKKSTNERNIKLTVVLMASRRMLGAFQSFMSLLVYGSNFIQTIHLWTDG